MKLLSLLATMLVMASCDGKIQPKTVTSSIALSWEACVTTPDFAGCEEFLKFELVEPLSVSNQPNVVFNWTDVSARDGSNSIRYTLVAARDAECRNIVFQYKDLETTFKQVQFESDGDYYICAYAMSGDKTMAAKRNGAKITIDQIAPLITAKQTEFTANQPIQPDVNVQDANAVTYSWQQVSESGRLIISDATAKNPTISFDKDGSYSVRLTVTDIAGNSSEKFFSITWGQVASSSLMATISGAPMGLVNSASFGATIGGDGVELYKFKLTNTIDCGDSIPYNAPVSISQPISGDSSHLGNGQIRLCVLGGNSAGSWQTIPSVAVWVVDAGMPTVTVSSFPAYVNVANQSAVPISGTCSENGRGIDISGPVSTSASCNAHTWSTNLNLSALSDGPYTLTIKHANGSSNEATINQSVTKNTTLPTIAINNIGINAANKTSYSLSGTCNANGQTVTISGAVSGTTTCLVGTWMHTFDLSAMADGNVSVTATIENTYGNSNSATATLIKDTVVPTLTLAAHGAINSSNKAAFTISGTCSENGRDVTIGGAVPSTVTCTGHAWSKVVDYSAIADGSVSLILDHSDATGNSATQISTSLTKDTTLPTVTITSFMINGANQAAVPVSGTCSEDGRTINVSGARTGTATCTLGA